ncbi:MAG: sulfite exporter TauE/SafE family protein [Geminicoccales bacterium]
MGFAEILILVGALAGGYVSGLTGFGTGLTALAIWLLAVRPVEAAPLVIICSIISQIQTFPAIWHAIAWRRVLPFVVGGLAGVPMGTMLLPLISLQTFKLLIGCLLIVYCSFMLLRRSTRAVSWGGSFADGVIGLGGGVLGGLAGLSGPLPTIWATLRGWGKDEKRGVFQAFNLSILLLAAAFQALGGFMTTEVGRLAIIALPGTLLGAWLGRKTYNRLGDGRFNQIVLTLLLLSGISIVTTWALML